MVLSDLRRGGTSPVPPGLLFELAGSGMGSGSVTVSLLVVGSAFSSM